VFDDHGFAEAVHFIGDKSMTNSIPATVNAVLSLVFLFWAFLCTPATADDREAPDEQAAAFRSMIAYTGKFRLEGEKFITEVDVAWNEAWVGTEQVRFWRLEGDRLHIVSAPIPNPNVQGSMMIGTLVWERE
jgi:hypothetical protein